MQAVIFGRENRETLLLLHGGGLSWWNYRETAQLLSARYRVILPILDGHAGSDAPFTTIEENAQRIIRYIDAHAGRQVLAIAGLSLGAQIAIRILALRPDICRYALVESALVKPMPLTHRLIAPTFGMCYGLIKQKWFAKLQFAYLRMPKALFDDYYRDTCRIQKGDLIAFLQANSAFAPPKGISESKATVMIAVGSREQKSMKDSARILHGLLPGSILQILPGAHHGQLSMTDPSGYARLLQSLWENGAV